MDRPLRTWLLLFPLCFASGASGFIRSQTSAPMPTRALLWETDADLVQGAAVTAPSMRDNPIGGLAAPALPSATFVPLYLAAFHAERPRLGPAGWVLLHTEGPVPLVAAMALLESPQPASPSTAGTSTEIPRGARLSSVIWMIDR